MKKVFALLVAGLFTFALIGCGSSSTTAPGTTKGETVKKDGTSTESKKVDKEEPSTKAK